MRALIVEDSRLARAELVRLLENYKEIEVVGEAVNADEAEHLIETLSPDLLLLDIELPGRDAFELLASLDAAPYVIFTTAYGEFAVRAFEQNALDYLVKPVQADRLSRALLKAQQLVENRQPALGRGILRGSDRVFVKDGEQCWFVALSDVRLLEVEGNYSRLFFSSHHPLIPKSLNYLETRLDAQTFFRASRRHIVNLNWIKDVEPWFSGSLRLTLKSGEVVEVSRRQTQRFREILSL